MSGKIKNLFLRSKRGEERGNQGLLGGKSRHIRNNRRYLMTQPQRIAKKSSMMTREEEGEGKREKKMPYYSRGEEWAKNAGHRAIIYLNDWGGKKKRVAWTWREGCNNRLGTREGPKRSRGLEEKGVGIFKETISRTSQREGGALKFVEVGGRKEKK